MSPHDIVASHWIDNGPGWRGILLKSDAQVRSLTVDSGRATLHPLANTFDWPAAGFAPAPTRSCLSECACSCTWSYGLGCHCTLPRWGHICIRSAPSRTQLHASCAHSPPGARLFPLCIRDNHRRPVHGLCSPASCTHAFEPQFYFNICFTDPLPSAAFVHPQSTGSLHAAFGVWLIGHPPTPPALFAPAHHGKLLTESFSGAGLAPNKFMAKQASALLSPCCDSRSMQNLLWQSDAALFTADLSAIVDTLSARRARSCSGKGLSTLSSRCDVSQLRAAPLHATSGRSSLGWRRVRASGDWELYVF